MAVVQAVVQQAALADLARVECPAASADAIVAGATTAIPMHAVVTRRRRIICEFSLESTTGKQILLCESC
ncbi:hypothetical protein GCM10009677_17620 [Sphaerisporangium rubeum]